jgi:hypothetical protein
MAKKKFTERPNRLYPKKTQTDAWSSGWDGIIPLESRSSPTLTSLALDAAKASFWL